KAYEVFQLDFMGKSCLDIALLCVLRQNAGAVSVFQLCKMPFRPILLGRNGAFFLLLLFSVHS
ncbi:hypothetical protein, partial [Xylanibacter rodentium]|uniref:hypothetical protein n=1 Tax=Xylanibacter rodentium TaxID=2736289 RepID=UPI0025582F28